jgi:hypothetical protein
MYRYSVHDQLLKDNIFALCFEELAFRKVLLDKKARILETVSIFSSCSLLVSFFIFIIRSFNDDTNQLDGLFSPINALFGFLAISSALGSIWLSHKYTRTHYPEFALFIKRNPFRYSTNILFLIRCDAVYELLRKERFNIEHIDNLLEYFENHGESIQKKRWLPIATYATFFFPFWSMIVNKLWDNHFRELLLLTLLFPACVLIWRNNFQTIILSKPQQYNQISRILRTIKNYPKF